MSSSNAYQKKMRDEQPEEREDLFDTTETGRTTTATTTSNNDAAAAAVVTSTTTSSSYPRQKVDTERPDIFTPDEDEEAVDVDEEVVATPIMVHAYAAPPTTPHDYHPHIHQPHMYPPYDQMQQPYQQQYPPNQQPNYNPSPQQPFYNDGPQVFDPAMGGGGGGGGGVDDGANPAKPAASTADSNGTKITSSSPLPPTTAPVWGSGTSTNAASELAASSQKEPNGGKSSNGADSVSLVERIRPHRKKIVIAAGVVLLLLVIVVVSTVASGGNSSGSSSTNTTSIDPNSRAALITNYINSIKLSTATLAVPVSDEILEPPTAEEFALFWLIYNDPLELLPDTAANQARMQQRYALLTIILQMSDATMPTTKEECYWLHVQNCTKSTDPATLEMQVVTDIYTSGTSYAFKKGSTLPPDVGLLNNLVKFDISGAGLSGSIPSSLGTTWTNLVAFGVLDNALTGSVPPSFGTTWANLTEFDVSHNDLIGSLQSSLGTTWTNLTRFDVRGNALTGTIPNAMASHWNQLQYAYFHNNSLVGSMPSGFCKDLTVAYLVTDWDEVTCSCCIPLCDGYVIGECELG